ncbi:HK97 family phage prohead protease [Sinorhizobium fredii]|uniref:HK97 family phage prohead protease n=1 Tax=Rhizobium fredii TaxID=380 RepID=UPI0004BBA30C|nr:HK97 family phage prohead protease [Sinorhizobium fredii]
MLTGFAEGDLILEERAAKSRSRRLRGRFPYKKRAILSDGGRTGRPRKEEFAPRAFAYNVEHEEVDIRLLVGHDFGKPLASRAAGTLELKDSDEALTFDATITEEMQGVSWYQDFIRAFDSRLIRGVSPGFRIPPERAVPKAEIIIQEEDEGPGSENRGAIIRMILAALLYELSLVTAPAYDEAEVEARNWNVTDSGLLVPEAPDAGLKRTLSRWRA